MRQRQGSLSRDVYRGADPYADPHGAGAWGAPVHAGEVGPGEGAAGSGGGLFKMVHRLLRGRYAITLVLAGLVGSAGAAAGWLSTTPQYRTVGMVKIRAQLPTVYGEAKGADYIHNMYEYVRSKAAEIRTERVLGSAMNSDRWKSAGFGSSQEDLQDLRDSMDVGPSRDANDILEVSVTSVDREYTRIAVDEIIHSYQEYFARESAGADDIILRTLENERNRIEVQIARKQTEVDTLAAQYGTDNLETTFVARQAKVEELSRRVDEAARRLRDRDVVVEGNGEAGAGEPKAPIPLGAAEIALLDPVLKEYLERERRLAAEIETHLSSGFSPEHPAIKTRKRNLEGIQAAIAKMVEDWNAGRRGGELPGVPGADANDPAVLRRTYEFLKDELERAQQDMLQTGQRRRELDALRDEIKKLKTMLEDQTARIQKLQTDSLAMAQSSGRISVLSYGYTPPVPTVDKRKQMGAAGLVLGGGLPIALMLLIGLVDRRYRYSDEAGETGGDVTLLGILPVLPNDLSNDEQRAAAAHCVHQIRLLLQMGGAREMGVFSVTSPTSGDGKTSLTLALGLSFASSGARTLLVDFDTIGTGLSSSLEVRDRHGVVDAIRSGDVASNIVPTAVPNLYLMPSASGDDLQVTRMAASQVRQLLERLREEYDVVLVDTGPILGSLEASMVANAVDGIVLVVGRGQQHTFVKKAVDRVRGIGGRLAGLVFNRATGSDFRRSVSSASVRSIRATRALPPGGVGPSATKRRLSKAGPVAQSLALEIDAGGSGDGEPAEDPAGGGGVVGSTKPDDRDTPRREVV